MSWGILTISMWVLQLTSSFNLCRHMYEICPLLKMKPPGEIRLPCSNECQSVLLNWWLLIQWILFSHGFSSYAGYLFMQCRYKTKRNWTLWGRQWESPLFSCHGRLSVYNCVNATLASQNLYLLYNNRTLRLLSRARFEPIDKRLRSRTASVPLTALWMLVLPPDWTEKILSHFESHRRFHRSCYSD